ncbi:Hypothetical predicted protein [Marmota monax]|uniref:Uncharacterized protein n=1 Tax=Marmota monax TaxID=9995 RepID=A0A5E4ABT0_MARMO|nr:Hypothetical predicted protein [Marmota monax]
MFSSCNLSKPGLKTPKVGIHSPPSVVFLLLREQERPGRVESGLGPEAGALPTLRKDPLLPPRSVQVGGFGTYRCSCRQARPHVMNTQPFVRTCEPRPLC